MIENTKQANSGFISEHGLSLFFVHNGKRILFDTGASDAFIYNATLLGIDLLKVDICVISHIHKDHTGGLESFFDINSKAKVYMKEAVKAEYYSKYADKYKRTGIDSKLLEKYKDRIVLFNGDMNVADGVLALSVEKYHKLPNYASNMFMKKQGKLVKDALEHELFLAVQHNGGAVVLTGCSHSGILNILMTAEARFGQILGVAGGFHLGRYSKTARKPKQEPGSQVSAIAKFITERNIKKVYTGHCTGDKPLEKLAVLARVKRMRTGDILEF